MSLESNITTVVSPVARPVAENNKATRKWRFVIPIALIIIVLILVLLNFIFPQCFCQQRKCKTNDGMVWFAGENNYKYPLLTFSGKITREELAKKVKNSVRTEDFSWRMFLLPKNFSMDGDIFFTHIEITGFSVSLYLVACKLT